MATPGARFLFILSAAALVGAALYGISTGGSALGVVSLGYKGGVGEHVGYVVLVSAGIMSGLLGAVLAAVSDADPAAIAAWAGVDEAPAVAAPKDGSWWPLVGAFAMNRSRHWVAISIAVDAWLRCSSPAWRVGSKNCWAATGCVPPTR